MCTDCKDEILNPTIIIEKDCRDCGEEQNKCISKYDAECVFYHRDTTKPSLLFNMGLPNKTSVEKLFERFDELLGNQFNINLTKKDSSSIKFTLTGPAYHTIKADVVLSTDPGNNLILKNNGLYSSPSIQDGKVKVSQTDSLNYLETKVSGGTDGIVSLSINSSGTNLNFNPTLDKNALLAYLNNIYVQQNTLPPPVVSTQYKDKLVPYVAYEYYGSLNNFDSTGVGLSVNGFEKIYLCNGANGTPDKRGRVAVGSLGVGGPAINSDVNPSITGKNLLLKDIFGKFDETLNSTQIPSHSHTINDPGHSHQIRKTGYAGLSGNAATFVGGALNPASTNGISENGFTNITLNPTGGGLSHNNTQPSIVAHFIMYIP